ncbi:hypothetical protein R5R35_011908 [Gryllus longicercus]|uniref:Accessory gland protein n=1 Tax=Gryllus longicercus TaxID=2509291 RepID=A0AAN9VYK5_9ORTH
MNASVVCAVLLLAVGAMAQYRPFYAGSGVNYPRPFGSSSSNDDLANRFGDSDLSTRIDANGHDVKLVEDAAKLPADQQPFWYINREHIRKHLGLDVTGRPVQPVQPFVVQPVVEGLPVHPVQPVVDPTPNIA